MATNGRPTDNFKARNFSPRKKRNKTISNPQQRIISQYFTPKKGINKEAVNFLAKPNLASRSEKTRRGTGDLDGDTSEYKDQITFSPTFGFTTAAKLHLEAGKWCSGAQSQQIFKGQHNSGTATCKSAVFGHAPKVSPLKNTCSLNERKQTHIDNLYTRVPHLMASSTSSSSSTLTSDSSSSSTTSPRKIRRTRSRTNSGAQNQLKVRSVKKQKTTPETITIDSGDETSSSDNDGCVIVNVARETRRDSEVDESSNCSQTSCTESSSQSSQASKEESNSQSSCTSESDQNNTSCKKSSSSSFKSARQAKKQPSRSARAAFGLVGGGDVSDSDDDDSQDSSLFARLPVEIMENIFCQLPIVDLMLNCALVCRQWYNIISRDSVMDSIFIN